MRVYPQVQCVREALLQMSSIYTDLVMRADLPASNRGVKVLIDDVSLAIRRCTARERLPLSFANISVSYHYLE